MARKLSLSGNILMLQFIYKVPFVSMLLEDRLSTLFKLIIITVGWICHNIEDGRLEIKQRNIVISHGVDAFHGKPTTARNAELFKINNQEKFKKLRYQLMFCCEIETLETHLLVALCEGCVEKFYPHCNKLHNKS